MQSDGDSTLPLVLNPFMQSEASTYTHTQNTVTSFNEFLSDTRLVFWSCANYTRFSLFRGLLLLRWRIAFVVMFVVVVVVIIVVGWWSGGAVVAIVVVARFPHALTPSSYVHTARIHHTAVAHHS